MSSTEFQQNCYFCKVSSGRADPFIFENRSFVGIFDTNPVNPGHVLVIPKGAYVSFDDFSAQASEAEIAGFVRAAGRIARDLGCVADGYRVLANTGRDANQEVPHFHLHLFAGKPLGRMIKPIDK